MAVYTYDPQTNTLKEYKTFREISERYGENYNTVYGSFRRKSKLIKFNVYVLSEKPSLKQRKEWYAKEIYKGERWLTVDGSDGKYRISNYGRVKIIYKSVERFAMPFRKNDEGNLQVKIRFKGKYQDHVVGHLVAHHFIRPRKQNERLFRKNGIRTDDFVGNLEYVSLQELGKRTGKLAKSKVVVKLCVHSLEWLDEYRSAREAGRQNYMSYQTVLESCHGRTKVVNGKYMFMFLEDYEEMSEDEREIS